MTFQLLHVAPYSPGALRPAPRLSHPAGHTYVRSCRQRLSPASHLHKSSNRGAGAEVPRAVSLQQEGSALQGAGMGAEVEIRPGVFEGYWQWKGHKIRYQRCGTEGPPVICVHGFGANADHWRKNLPVLGQSCRAYAIDLLGYG
jgi:hypothetical protein